jgi:hypothetical protein
MRSRFSTGRPVQRVVGVLVLGLVVAAVVSVAGVSATSTSQTTASQAAFRQQFMTYLQQMQHVAKGLQATPQGRLAMAQVKVDPSANLARARVAVQRMTPAQLAVLQRAFSAYPKWRTIPAKLQMLVDRMRKGKASGRSVAITPNDCATARAAGYTQTDVEIAADAALAADVVLEAVPDDVLSLPVRLVAVALWAIPQGVLRGFEHLYNIASACDDEDHQALVQQNLDVKVSTRATQTSVDTIGTNVNTLTTNFNSLSTLVNTNLDAKVSTRATQASLDAFQTAFTNNATVVNNKLDGLQTSVNTANTKLDSALTKLDTIQSTINANAAGDLRLKIEENLAQPNGQGPIIAFMLPEPNGHLGLVHDIVLDSIQKLKAAGQSVGSAESAFAQAVAQQAAGNYEKAYQFYAQAYRAAAG